MGFEDQSTFEGAMNMEPKPFWTAVTDCSTSHTESVLQGIFDHWEFDKNGWQIVGAPAWFLRCGGKNLRKQFLASGGYRFTPDVIWQSAELLVIELKRSAKFEEIALVEVLHHVWELREKFRQAPIPVVIGSQSPWTRSALCYLRENGLRKDAVRFLEASLFHDANGGKFLWLYEPFAQWLPADQLPACVASNWRGPGIHWYKIEGSDTWAGCIAGTDFTRPITPECVLFSQVDGQANRYLCYACYASKPRERYFLREPSEKEEVLTFPLFEN